MSKYRRRKPGGELLPRDERPREPDETMAPLSTQAEPEVVSDERTYGLDPSESRDYPQRDAEEVNPSYTNPPAQPGTGQPRTK